MGLDNFELQERAVAATGFLRDTFELRPRPQAATPGSTIVHGLKQCPNLGEATTPPLLGRQVLVPQRWDQRYESDLDAT